MRLLPRTLFGQILLALFVGLLAAQALGFWLMLDERVRLRERLGGYYTAQRIAGIISILDHAERADRARLLRALDVPPTRISLSQPWDGANRDDSEDAQAFMERIAAELDQPIRLQVLALKRAELRRRDEFGRRMPRADHPMFSADHEPGMGRRWRGGPPIVNLVGQAMLSDGEVLTFRHALPHPSLDWPLRLLGLLTVLGVSVALLAGWAVRRLTRPLEALSDAASGLARNLEQPPLPETGPLEVSRAARAFNAMQRDLKRYLETRAAALAGVSHDLRIPLTRLRLRLERLPDDELKAQMESDLSEMDKMIGNTLDFLRAGRVPEKPVRMDINALLESMAEDEIALGAQVRLHGRAAGPVTVRPQALRRCLANLLDNARRYGGGEIDLSVAEQDGWLEIRVGDRGPGIPEAERERVFEPYVRLDSSRAKHTGGSGLGLAIARAIARAQGGDLTLAARDGGGACAILTLPRQSDE
jgi:signal transduction histidine kinase